MGIPIPFQLCSSEGQHGCQIAIQPFHGCSCAEEVLTLSYTIEDVLDVCLTYFSVGGGKHPLRN